MKAGQAAFVCQRLKGDQDQRKQSCELKSSTVSQHKGLYYFFSVISALGNLQWL